MNNNMMMMFRQFMSNPGQMMQSMGIPQNLQGNPQAVIQHLMDTGRISQAQYNQAQQAARNFMPMLKNLK